MVGELAGGIAHEIRNPLTSLKGFTQLIEHNNRNQKIDQYLHIMLDELERINTIVNEFMVIAKPNQDTKMEKIDIGQLISNVVSFMEPQSNLRGVKINTYIKHSLHSVCDTNQIKQVLINLIQNALEASTTNKNIDVSLTKIDNHNFLIKIQDYGNGMEDERQKRLFEPFYSTKEKGTGLGLMVCKRIIDHHNGQIEVSSKKGVGTTVSVILPIVSWVGV